MQRMMSDNVWEMEMRQWALNRVYIGKDGRAWYREQPEREYSACDLIRAAAETLGVELPMLSDSGLSDLMAEFLQYSEGEPEGVLAVLYGALCAQAELRARLSDYEDTELEPEGFEAAAMLDERKTMGGGSAVDFPKREAEVLLAWMREQMYGDAVTQWTYGNEHDCMLDCADLIQDLVDQADRLRRTR